MFKTLRNRFIIASMTISSIILFSVLISVFIVTAMSQHRRPAIERSVFMPQKAYEVINREFERKKTEDLADLALTLIAVGLVAELLIFCASYCFAERAIKPVREAYEKQHDFIANASHELKTPIAAAQANFEALGTTEQPWTKNVETELERASTLINNMLTLARLENQSTPVERIKADVSALLKTCVEPFRARLGKKSLKLNCPEVPIINLSPPHFREIANILLDNAIKYSKNRIEITLTETTLTISNDGKSIPPDQLPYIFDRFYQTDKSSNGVGLGLAIAKSIADTNGWDLSVSSEENRTTFTLNFIK